MNIQSKLKQAAILSAMSMGLASPIMATENVAAEATQEQGVETSTEEKGKKKFFDTTAGTVVKYGGIIVVTAYITSVGISYFGIGQKSSDKYLNPFSYEKPEKEPISGEQSNSEADDDDY